MAANRLKIPWGSPPVWVRFPPRAPILSTTYRISSRAARRSRGPIVRQSATGRHNFEAFANLVLRAFLIRLLQARTRAEIRVRHRDARMTSTTGRGNGSRYTLQQVNGTNDEPATFACGCCRLTTKGTGISVRGGTWKSVRSCELCELRSTRTASTGDNGDADPRSHPPRQCLPNRRRARSRLCRSRLADMRRGRRRRLSTWRDRSTSRDSPRRCRGFLPIVRRGVRSTRSPNDARLSEHRESLRC